MECSNANISNQRKMCLITWVTSDTPLMTIHPLALATETDFPSASESTAKPPALINL